MQPSEQIIVCLTTVGDLDQADELAKQLIEQAVAACVQIDGPIISHYHWDDQQHRDEEYRLIIKTSISKRETLAESIRKHHPYDLPQIVMLKSEMVDESYAAWISETTRRLS